MEKLPKNFHTKTICIDLDGTLTEFTRDLNSVGKFKPDAENALRILYSWGYDIVILTARKDLKPVRKFIKEKKLQGIVKRVTNKKPSAILYIDDRGVYYDGDWENLLKNVEVTEIKYRKRDERAWKKYYLKK